MEEVQIKPGPAVAEIEQFADDDKLIEAVKLVFLKTNLTGLIPTKVYYALTERKLIDLDNDDKKHIRASVEEKLHLQAVAEGLEALKDYRILKNNPREYEAKVRSECKRHAVAKYFTLQNDIDNFLDMKKICKKCCKERDIKFWNYPQQR